MNFTGRMEGQELHIELKYCERCGGLWLRPMLTAGVHCASCRVQLASLPDPGEPAPRTTKRRNPRLKLAKSRPGCSDAQVHPTQVEYLQGVAAVGVWA
jgi:hypothetical protein